MKLPDFLENEQETSVDKIITFSDGEKIDLTDFKGVVTWENLLYEYGPRIAEKYWNEKVMKIKWNIFFEGLENTNLGG